MNKDTQDIIKVRPYLPTDWPMVLSWWTSSKEVAPLEAMMPLDSSFIAEIAGVPALAVTIYLTNTKEIAYVEHPIGNPEMKGPSRREAARVLSEHIASFAKSLGYKRLVWLADKQILVNRLVELGYTPALSGVTTVVRSL